MMRQALAINVEIGNRKSQAFTLLNLGATYCLRSDYDAAEDCGRQALELFEALGGGRSRANAIASIGNARLRRGDHDAATALLEQAASLFREATDDHELATVLGHLAEAYELADRGADAEHARREALSIASARGDVTRQQAPRVLLPE